MFMIMYTHTDPATSVESEIKLQLGTYLSLFFFPSLFLLFSCLNLPKIMQIF